MYGLTKCCCCLDLRIGTIIIAILELLIGIPYFVLAILKSIAIHPVATSDAWNDNEQLQSSDAFIIALTAFNYLKSAVALIIGLCLLFGSIYYNKKATLIYLVLRLIGIVVSGIEFILGIVAAYTIRMALPVYSLHPITEPIGYVVYYYIVVPIICMTVYIFVTMVFQTYFWICVLSFYNRSLKRKEIVSHT